jgi:hypothetical protein
MTSLNPSIENGWRRSVQALSGALLVVGLALSGCMPSSSETDEVGTGIANPPTLPTASYTPEFTSYLFETAITSEDEDAAIVALTDDAEPALLNGPAADWTEIFLQGPVAYDRTFRRTFQEFGESLAAAAAADPDFVLSESPYTLTLSDVTLVDATRDWTVRVSITADGAIEVIIQQDDDEIWGYYLFATDDSGNPVRGIFAYVNHDRLSAAVTSGLRFYGLAFDVTDTSSARVTTGGDAFNEQTGRFIAYNLHLECATSRDCLGEFLAITAAAPHRDLSSHSVRLGWDDTARAICLATAHYDDDDLTLGTTQAFIGPDEPTDVTEGACTIDEPHWQDHRHFLPLRFDDTEPHAGLAGLLTGSGSNAATWRAVIDLDAIDRWLGGEFR